MPIAALAAAAALAGGVLFVGKHRIARKVDHVLERVGLAADAPAPMYAGPKGTLDVHARALGAHPRFLLTHERLARLAALRDPGTTSWRSLLDECRKARGETVASGYEGWDWANAALGLALCARVTGDASYGEAGVRYFTALLDDKTVVGDHLGGDRVVQHDDGYPIRTHGWIGAIAYDWLADAPGMTPALRKKAVDRFVAWTSWFKEKGYNHDHPISNYYASYFGAVAFAGLACAGDDPRAGALAEQGQRMWNQEIVPTFRTKLDGGDFPEGWQYGDLVGTLLALYADAENAAHPAGTRSLFDDLPWLRQTVALRAAALLPNGKDTYDNGDWSNKPAVAPPEMLSALEAVLPPGDPAGRKATFLARLSRSNAKGEWKWLEAVAADPARPAEDPRRGEASYLSRGTATVFARSSFAPSALWLSLTSAPSLSDHEHLDAGHFEIVRGGDPLLIDSGDYSSYSSLSHNVVIVDDPLQSSNYEESAKTHPIITYKKNQGLWSNTAHIARFEDGGGYVYALADYASAFNPSGYPKERSDHAVSRAEREVVFSRAAVAGAGGGETGRVVVYDRLTLTDPRFTTTFILHGGRAPQITGALAHFTNGSSAAWVTTLLPPGGASSVVDETHNTYSNDRPFFTNKPPDGVTSFRYEVASPASPASTERRFLHAIVVGALATEAPGRASAGEIRGAHLAGVALDGEAYVFSSEAPATRASALTYTAPAATTRHIVADLAPGAGYAVAIAPDGAGCKVTLTPGGGKSASAAGVIALDASGCNLR